MSRINKQKQSKTIVSSFHRHYFQADKYTFTNEPLKGNTAVLHNIVSEPHEVPI